MTNKKGYPEVMVDLVSKHDYHHEEGISVTQLIDSPQIRRLTLEHRDEIEDDIHDRYQTFFGHMAHTAMEVALAGTPTNLERRIYHRVGEGMNGTTVHGTPDVYWPALKLIQDWKTVSVWSVVFDKIKKWTEQLNCYAWLLKKNGMEVDKLEIVVIYRDWVAEKAKQQGYPDKWSEVIPLSLWSDEEQDNFILDRLFFHKNAEDCICTSEEMWERSSTWALIKKGNKRADRVVGDYDTAKFELMSKVAPQNYDIVERPGERVRCERYCNVNKWCKQFEEYSNGRSS